MMWRRSGGNYPPLARAQVQTRAVTPCAAGPTCVFRPRVLDQGQSAALVRRSPWDCPFHGRPVGGAAPVTCPSIASLRPQHENCHGSGFFFARHTPSRLRVFGTVAGECYGGLRGCLRPHVP
jgi:hypothetical protein